MMPALFRIPAEAPGQLAVAARPRGGDWLGDEVRGWVRHGITDVVSMLEPAEEADLGLAGENQACELHGIAFHPVPVPDRGLPGDEAAFQEAVEAAAERVLAGRSVAVHCRQGIGRSGMFAAAVLIRLGANAADAAGVVSAARGRTVPETPEQVDWLRRYRPHPMIRTGPA